MATYRQLPGLSLHLNSTGKTFRGVAWLPSNTGDFEYVKWQALTWKIIRTVGSYK